MLLVIAIFQAREGCSTSSSQQPTSSLESPVAWLSWHWPFPSSGAWMEMRSSRNNKFLQLCHATSSLNLLLCYTSLIIITSLPYNLQFLHTLRIKNDSIPLNNNFAQFRNEYVIFSIVLAFNHQFQNWPFLLDANNHFETYLYTVLTIECAHNKIVSGSLFLPVISLTISCQWSKGV